MQEHKFRIIENSIAALALFVAGGAFALAYRADSATVSPNIVSLATTGRTDFPISCSGAHCDPERLVMWFFDLQNVGRANVQIVSIGSDVLTSDEKEPKLALSLVTDAPCNSPPEEMNKHKDKVLGLKNPLIPPDSVKRLCVLAVGTDLDQKFLGSRVKLDLSNGQSLVVFSRVGR